MKSKTKKILFGILAGFLVLILMAVVVLGW